MRARHPVVRCSAHVTHSHTPPRRKMSVPTSTACRRRALRPGWSCAAAASAAKGSSPRGAAAAAATAHAAPRGCGAEARPAARSDFQEGEVILREQPLVAIQARPSRAVLQQPHASARRSRFLRPVLRAARGEQGGGAGVQPLLPLRGQRRGADRAAAAHTCRCSGRRRRRRRRRCRGHAELRPRAAQPGGAGGGRREAAALARVPAAGCGGVPRRMRYRSVLLRRMRRRRLARAPLPAVHRPRGAQSVLHCGCAVAAS